MKNKKISQILGFENLRHKDIPFVDIIPHTDVRLYLDPILIDSSDDPLIIEFSNTIKDFFECVVEACKTKNDVRLNYLLQFGGEKNSTHLGMSEITCYGKGASRQILKNVFLTLSNLYNTNHSPHISELNVLIKNFSDDRMSDLLTNILLKCLYNFTSEQQEKYDIPQENQLKKLGYFWDINTHSWLPLIARPFTVDGIDIILVPKSIVRKNLCCTVERYLWHQFIPQRQDFHLQNNTALAELKYNKKQKRHYLDKPSKKAVYNAEIVGHNSKKIANDFFENKPSTLINFINNRIGDAKSGKYTMTDSELDQAVEIKTRNVS